MTAADASGALRVMIEIDYGQWYVFDPDRVDAIGDLASDPVRAAELWEKRCASSGGAAIVYALKQHGPTEVIARSLPSAPALDRRADHVAECSVVASGGRLVVTGWDTSIVAGEVPVPDQPLRVRIGWFGLDREMETDDKAAERFTIDVFPGDPGPSVVLRCWPTWVPPEPESRTEEGLRRFTGVAAAEAISSLEPSWISFWSPYPETADGAVTSLLRDPRDGSRWALGPGFAGHQILRELTPEQAGDLEAQGFPQGVLTYAIDAEGRIWSAGQMPLERTPCLDLTTRAQFEFVTGMPAEYIDHQVVDLPPGWGRLIRRTRDGSGPPEEVEAIDDTDDGFYQRWPDDKPAPTS